MKKIIIIPPYSNENNLVKAHTIELMERNEKRGQITKEEYFIDDGYFIDWLEERRDAEFLANISLGIIKKVKEYNKKEDISAIICSGSMEPAFYPAREISDVPFVGALHSALHIASFIGEKCMVLEAKDTQAMLVRRHAKTYGFDHKLISARNIGYSSTDIGKKIEHCPKSKRLENLDIRRIIESMVEQCLAAVKEDCVDSIILACQSVQVFEDDIRKQLDIAGFSEIPLICELSAAIAMAKAIVGMNLKLSRIAYPRPDNKVKPRIR